MLSVLTLALSNSLVLNVRAQTPTCDHVRRFLAGRDPAYTNPPEGNPDVQQF